MSIENLVLARDQRGVSALRPYLAPDFCERAAALVVEHPGTVLIATGFYVPSAGATETDGPPGAAALGQALEALGYRVLYVTDERSSTVVRGLVPAGSGVVEFPLAGHEESRRFAAGLIASHAPALVVAVERCGLTDEGLHRNMHGADVSAHHAKLDYLFVEGLPSVGVGDGGNEIGMGNLLPVIPLVMPTTEKPCVTKTTRLVISSVSNWGAWGIVAAMSRLTGRVLLPTPAQARATLERAVRLGAVDGVSGRATLSVDGFPAEENERLLAEMHAWLARHGVGAAA
ncbi:MAG TPA: DUF4392 domain-containing protein [Vicinamibacterales bacterium]|nr:DUF4392 domain-containing protein [Vicinamibacterales bacterium]